jgi:putative hydrolase of the HAD superfamily
MIGCIAFDMDDTLYDELDYYRSGLAAVASAIARDNALNERVVFETLWAVFMEGNHKATFNETLDKLAISYNSDYISKLVDVLRLHSPKISLPADSRAVLEELKGHCKLALITDGFLPAQKLKVRALDIEKYFDVLLFTEEWGREFWKPSAFAFEKLLKEMALRPEQCIYVGDNPTKDFMAPNKLGFKTVQITRENHLHTFPAPEASARAQYHINTLSELLNLLGQM